jgi:tetratricopeptide (TPR) repeat protein
MQGWGVYFRGLTRDNLVEAGRLFDAAVARDPQSIRGWGGVAVINGVALAIQWAPDRATATARLELAAERLLALDEDGLFAHLARSNLANLRADYEGWLLLLTRTIERFPSHAPSHGARGLALMNLGRFDECVAPARRAILLGPRDPFVGLWNWQIGTCHFMRGEYREAAQFARNAQQAGPNLPLPPLLLAAALSRAGHDDEARAIVAEYVRRHPAYRAADIEKLMRSQHPRYVEVATVWSSRCARWACRRAGPPGAPSPG